ncbi:MAG: LLM class flavin-dependent oxidoreductase [Jiangellaceae bacterium]
MKLGIDVAQQRLDFDEVVERVRFGEDLGFDGAWGFDHLVPMYGEGPGNCFEGMTTLAALAGRTSRIRLGLLVAGVTYRHPSVLAAEAVTVDHASNGRLELGIGAAWYEPEHLRLGIDFPPTGERFDLLEDQLEIFVRLFTGEVVSYDGRRVSLDGAQLRPLPVQRPRPPIWIGGSGPHRTLPLVARYADVWHTNAIREYREASVQVDRLAEQAGRDPSAIGRAASLSLSEPWNEVRRNAQARRDLGLDYLVCSWPGQGRRRVEEFWTTIAPELLD